MSDWNEWRGKEVAEPNHDPGTFDPLRDAETVLKDGFFRVVDKDVRFVREWAEATRNAREPGDVRKLITRREGEVKGAAQRRFASPKARQRWGGVSDVTMADFRWSAAARRFLLDMHAEGLRRSEVI